MAQVDGKLEIKDRIPMAINIPMTNKPHVVVVGGGFAGIEFAKGLRGVEVELIMVDKNNYHTFQPLLYQVATASLEPDSIAYPLREMLRRQENFFFRLGEVLKVNPEENFIETSIGRIPYDYLVLAVGSRTNYFGMEDIRKYACPMKSVPEAMELRNLMLENFERALLTKDLETQESLMNIVVVGGGPTGIEMAGALGELRMRILPHDYPELNFSQMQIHLIDLEDRLLKSMSEEASRSAERFLKRFDINLWLKTTVTAYDGHTLSLSNGKKLLAKTVIWAAGVTGAIIPGFRPETVVANRLRVDQFNQVNGYENIFAIGDIATMVSDKNPKGHPMLAPIAIKQARLLARNFKRMFAKEPLEAFVYRDFGVMATIGRNHAVVDLPFVKFQGFFAWFVWLFVHLMALVGFRNKLVAFVNWAWSYFTYDRGLRLIIRPHRNKE